MLDGDPGTGKSFVTIDLACRLSRGRPMPEGTGTAPPATVLLMNAEDDARDTIRPRVLAADGDPDRVRVFAAPGIGLDRVPRFPEDFDRLEAAVRETQAARTGRPALWPTHPSWQRPVPVLAKVTWSAWGKS